VTAKAEISFRDVTAERMFGAGRACLPRMPNALIVVEAEAEISFRDVTAERMFGAGWPACLINLEKNCIIQSIKFLQEQ
jgi:hypothetical protein